MVLRSKQFDDVYFSVDDGMAETRHVFLDGNDLPNSWADKDNFTIINMYLAKYPIRVPGPHQIEITDRVTLTVWFGDIANVMGDWTGQVDAWFLDGFTPAKNPDMWRDELFQNMARLSHSETTFATFTAAGFVKRGLESAGFAVEKTKGFGRKRDMLRGVYNQEDPPIKSEDDAISKIAIIGGGLAGCAMAYMAQRHGIKATIYEAGKKLAIGASGGQKGMINPKLTANTTAQSNYYTSAYANALRVLVGLDDIDFSIHGSKHLCTDDDKDRRFTGYIDNLGWHDDHMYRDEDGHMIYPDGASICPEKLCHALAKNADIFYNHTIKDLDDIDADVIVLANGHAVKGLLPNDLPVNWVRGQVSWLKSQADVSTNISYGGYITPQTPEGFHVLGSTLDPKNESTELRVEDHQEVLRRYNERMEKNLTMDDIIGGWSALRTSSKDRFPVVGQVDNKTYISTAHGSHGIISSLFGARILLSLMQGEHQPVTKGALKALSPERFRKR